MDILYAYLIAVIMALLYITLHTKFVQQILCITIPNYNLRMLFNTLIITTAIFLLLLVN